ncbi:MULTISPECIES: 1-deoxy-D-xylulose-5-phosphate reductoisomerase [unclassified Chelatococcus]|uniref:1-deoxy-D-xylulose-5-phosphate reductoisomerase n=1 Tax=unclassified Chelatococcus TaxID=2638111 RepID=UPI0002E07C98|nr:MULTISPECIES: 1-deoxy-D-xylulose-5-phosphate reductoisomerase [unclassified Chelatococcus]ALA18914.1 1-deoxy-D-xylulose 5-phosphate reductoisomerase [Chelatococcus sp. CO-6]
MATRLIILGASGSVGRAVADVVAAHPGRFEVEAVVAGRDARALADVALRLRARCAVLADGEGGAALAEALSGSGIVSGAGGQAVLEAVDRDCDLVVAAIAGTAGLRPTHRALRAGRRIALANKECLVSAGAAFMRDAAAAGATILPLDSEHNALFQALGGAALDDVEAMTLTASGGPFRDWPAKAIAEATPQEALKHPNWSMGAKITVDSAGLMNKGLELIEAHHLFGLPAARLRAVVHPQSIVHGIVHFRDGSLSAGLAVPDMRVPVAHCLAWPERVETEVPRLDLAAMGCLTFAEPDTARFPALRLAREALEQGGAAPTVLNAANEVAVEAFLAGRIRFGDIARLVEAVCTHEGVGAAPAGIDEALAVDFAARERARALLQQSR